ncbi:MAG: aldo/keto reductase, partial [Bdellovibrionales bacterium]|nr:aldo/keto reductase [Bdellovibrionales bacterium]NQZ19581.1 aldo/keto reductase [Bdellovibrionales bacterium]
EALQEEGLVKHIGLSNVSAEQLKEFYDFAEVKPKFAQIRCFAQNMWEKAHRDFCNQKDIIFQGFSLLTANRQFLEADFVKVENRTTPQLQMSETLHKNNPIQQIMKDTGKSSAQIIFRFSQQIGMLPITGTTSFDNMTMDLDIKDFTLTESQIEEIEKIAFY